MELTVRERAVLTEAARQMAVAHGITTAAAAERIRRDPVRLGEFAAGHRRSAEAAEALRARLAGEKKPRTKDKGRRTARK